MIQADDLHRRTRATAARAIAAFEAAHPVPRAPASVAQQNFAGGVPMHRMLDREMPFALSIPAARGGAIDEADGLGHVDLRLGDSGAGEESA